MDNPNEKTENIDDEAADDQKAEDKSEESDEKASEDQESDEKASDEDAEEKGDDEEFWDSEKDYLKQFGLPGEPENIEDVVTNYKALLEKEKTQKVEPEKDLSIKTEPEKEKSEKDTLSEKPLADHITKLISDGHITKEDQIASYRGIAQVVDAAYGPAIKSMREANQGSLNTVAAGLSLIIKHIRDQSWNSFEHKTLAQREAFDKVMNDKGYLDYGAAFRDLAVAQHPDWLKKLIGVEGGNDGKNKKHRRFSGLRRGSHKASAGPKWKGYVNADGTLDKGKLNALPSDEASKITDAYVEHAKKEAAKT